MLARPIYLDRLRSAIRRSPVTALLGPRQCGKTTLARMLDRITVWPLREIAAFGEQFTNRRRPRRQP